MGKNVVIQVRNGYYADAPQVDITSLTSESLYSKAESYRNIYLFPSTFGIGGDGADGESGKAGKSFIYYHSPKVYTIIKGHGGSGGGGGGGGYGGGVLYIAAQKIVYDAKYPPRFIVSGQVGGSSWYKAGQKGSGGLLIIYSSTTNLPSSIWQLTSVLVAKNNKCGHGNVVGGPQSIFINGIKN